MLAPRNFSIARPRRSTRTLAGAAAALVIASCMTGASMSAQGMLGSLKKRAADAVEQKANRKVNQKIDEVAAKLVDRSFDSMFGAAGDSEGGGEKAGGFALLPNAPTEPFYDFDASLIYEIERMPKGKSSNEKLLVTMLLNSDGKYSGTRLVPEDTKKGDGDLFAIFDLKNESMVMLITSDKQKMSMAYGWKNAKHYGDGLTEPATGSDPATTVASPTARPMTFASLGTRTIAGYSAEGYKGENEDGVAEVWVTRDADLPSGHLMGTSASIRQMRGVMPGSYPTGTLLEVISTDRKSGDTGRMTIKSVNSTSKTRIDMSEYPRVGVGSR